MADRIDFHREVVTKEEVAESMVRAKEEIEILRLKIETIGEEMQHAAALEERCSEIMHKNFSLQKQYPNDPVLKEDFVVLAEKYAHFQKAVSKLHMIRKNNEENLEGFADDEEFFTDVLKNNLDS